MKHSTSHMKMLHFRFTTWSANLHEGILYVRFKLKIILWLNCFNDNNVCRFKNFLICKVLQLLSPVKTATATPLKWLCFEIERNLKEENFSHYLLRCWISINLLNCIVYENNLRVLSLQWFKITTRNISITKFLFIVSFQILQKMAFEDNFHGEVHEKGRQNWFTPSDEPRQLHKTTANAKQNGI